MKVVYFGDASNEFSNRHYLALEQVCEAAAVPGTARAVGGRPCVIAAVVDSPKSGWVSTRQGGADASPPFDLRAREQGIPIVRGFPDREADREAVRASLAALEPDLFVAVGYTRRLGPPLLEIPRLGAVNFHASLLPAYRGKHPVFWALHSGERVSGLTVHRMDPRIDAGEILYQVRVRTRMDDTVAGLYERIMTRSVGLMSRLVRDARRERLRGRPQDEAASSYYSATGPEDFRIRFSMPAELIARRAAATPGRCWFLMRGRRIHVLEAGRVDGGASSAPGILQSLGRRHAVIAANPGTVRLRRLAAEDGRELPAAGFLRDAGLAPGDRLEE